VWPHGAARGPGSLSLVLIMTLVLLTFCRTVSLTPPIHHAAAAGKGPAPSVAAEVDQSLTSHRICRRGRGEVPLASEDEPQAEGKERGGAQRRILRGGGRSGEFWNRLWPKAAGLLVAGVSLSTPLDVDCLHDK